MANIFYSEVGVLCVIILCMILYKKLTGSDKSLSSCIFNMVIVSTILFLICDVLWALGGDSPVHTNTVIAYLINILYFVFSTLVAFLWFIYSETKQDSLLVRNKKYMPVVLIPFIAAMLIIISTFKTGWLFYLDENNEYHRGGGFALQQVLAYMYVIISSVKAHLKSIRKENYINRKQYRTLALFIVIPFIFGMLQIAFYGTPLLGVGITLAILQFYMNVQDQRISIDYLTHLSNRNQMEKVLAEKIKNHDKNKQLYLLILDADHFKKINDNYGHIEGDRALMRISDALRKICLEKKDCFISRYGGDEFILICEAETRQEIDTICSNIAGVLTELNEKAMAPYEISLSIGYAQYTSDIKYIPDFIAIADADLYEKKREKKLAVYA